MSAETMTRIGFEGSETEYSYACSLCKGRGTLAELPGDLAPAMLCPSCGGSGRVGVRVPSHDISATINCQRCVTAKVDIDAAALLEHVGGCPERDAVFDQLRDDPKGRQSLLDRLRDGGPVPEAAPPTTPRHDPVEHPRHYTTHPSGVECIAIVEHLGFCVGNAIKYLWRCGLKGDEIEDLKKARWYIDREIERRTKAKGPSAH